MIDKDSPSFSIPSEGNATDDSPCQRRVWIHGCRAWEGRSRFRYEMSSNVSTRVPSILEGLARRGLRVEDGRGAPGHRPTTAEGVLVAGHQRAR